METWRPVVGYEGFYEVSDLGRVRSTTRPIRTSRNPTLSQTLRGKVLKQRLRSGYPSVNLCVANKPQSCCVHSLVLEAFRGPRPPGLEGCHDDGCRGNSALSNLRWDTKLANEQDKVDHGHSPKGEKNLLAKLREPDIRRAFALRAEGKSFRQIAGLLGCTRANVGYIINRKTWSHVA
jgi:hypothetical protein